MENEAKAAPVQYRTQMLGRLRNYRRDVDQMSKDVVNIYYCCFVVANPLYSDGFSQTDKYIKDGIVH